jgi:hypothetical protein
MPHFNFAKRPSKSTDRQKLVRKLDEEFSAYIRLRDSDIDGYITCITCGDRVHHAMAQCGHYMKRGNASTRYDLKNSAGQCSTCNCARDGMQEDHAYAIDKLYGAGTADKLERQSREERHYAEFELSAMYKELQAEVKALKIEKFN